MRTLRLLFSILFISSACSGFATADDFEKIREKLYEITLYHTPRPACSVDEVIAAFDPQQGLFTDLDYTNQDRALWHPGIHWRRLTELACQYRLPDSPYSNGVISVDTVLSNEAVVPPETNPTRENYTFTGWYASALGNTKIEFDDNTRIKANTGYYAHWKHDLVETDTFQAEYVYFDPNKQYWGYSGGVVGHKCIVKDPGTAGTVMVDDYPLNSVLTDHYGFYVSYQYEKGCTLRFEIESSAATSATLLGNFAMEGQNGAPNVTSVSNTGDYATQITVNGTPLTYTLNFSDTAFHEMEVGTVQLKEGLNVIEIIVDNSNNVAGGTYKATGFNTDYIKLDGASSTLSWSPIYDNLEEVF